MTRDKTVLLRFTKEEKEQVEAYARKQHTPLAVLVRQIILKESDVTVNYQHSQSVLELNND